MGVYCVLGTMRTSDECVRLLISRKASSSGRRYASNRVENRLEQDKC